MPARLLCLLFCVTLTAFGQDPFASLLNKATPPGTFRTAVGVDRHGTAVPALLSEEDLDYATPKRRILLVAGLDGSSESAEAAMAAWRWFHSPEAKTWRDDFALSVVPVGNPYGWAHHAGSSNGSGGDPTTGYPPEGTAYNSETNPEAQYLWRWIGMHAPDLVVVLEKAAPASGGLAAALEKAPPSDTGTIPVTSERGSPGFLEKVLKEQAPQNPSPARREIQSRLDRTPTEVAEQLAKVYGHALDEVVYIPTVALISRIRLGQTEDVERIVAPYVAGKPTLPPKPTSSHLPGHLIFAELYRVTQNPRYLRLARDAANLGYDDWGVMRKAMPFHSDMSDSFFMGCAILAEVGALSGERRYFDIALRHMRYMEGLDLRDDGLYRHSPLDEAAWGRGNGFPALGLAWSLSFIPENDRTFAPMLAAFQRHMAALLPYQDRTGAWHQVIDKEGSYRELTSTSMIGFALARGLERGWLDGPQYEKAVERAWYAVKTRVAANGELVDVCTGTGKQPDLRSYYDRTAILGKDDRGGAMAMLFATELGARQ
ncbi:MAG: hypothetical protein GC160_26955 [Acidobacteria bacterium]|nr:hypothetical protein [Acidobacteriota bacterium]